MESLWYCLCVILLCVVMLYGLIEVHYFLRMCLCVILARFVKRKCAILDTTTVSGLCLTNDIDTLLSHMNNARYFRELDFARVDFYERTQLYRTIIAKGGSVFQGSATIRYRRFIKPFHLFQITSKIVYWDDQSVYMEHRFVRPSDQFVHSICVCRQRIINCSAEEVMNELLAPRLQLQSSVAYNNAISPTISGGGIVTTATALGSGDAAEHAENGQVHVRLKPDVPPEIQKWIEYNDLSSKNLRMDCPTG